MRLSFPSDTTRPAGNTNVERRNKMEQTTGRRETGDGQRRKLIAGKQTDTDEEGLEERPSGAEDRNRWL